MTTQVGIYIFPDAEVLDFAGPYEVLTTASRMAARQNPQAAPLFSVFSVAAQPELVRLRAGLMVQPTFTFADHPPIDLLLVPGGMVSAELEKTEVIDWLRETSQAAKLTASVCTGAFLLAKTGLLNQHAVTTHWEDLADLKTTFPALRVIEQQRWVDAGRYVTSAGISAGIDMSLHLVERLAGRALAEATAHQMEYCWQDQGRSEPDAAPNC